MTYTCREIIELSTVSVGGGPTTTADGTTVSAAKRATAAGIGAGVSAVVDVTGTDGGGGGHSQGSECGELHFERRYRSLGKVVKWF